MPATELLLPVLAIAVAAGTIQGLAGFGSALLAVPLLALLLPVETVVPLMALLDELNEPLLSSTLILPGEDMPMMDPYEMNQILGHAVDLIVDGGYCGFEPTSVIDLHEETPKVWRVGKGDVSLFEA